MPDIRNTMSGHKSLLELPLLTESYSALIERFLQLGYEVRNSSHFNPSQRHLLLRHDVDLDLGAALEMAQMESQLGLKSTFFILVTCPFYNALVDSNVKIIRQIIKLGHNIGVHVDLQGISNMEEMRTRIEAEALILSNISESTVESFTFHRPGMLKSMEKVSSFQVSGFSNFYEPRLCGHSAYVSDSRGGWYHGHPLEASAVIQGKGIQLLTHPIWWGNIAQRCRTAVDVLCNFQEQNRRSIDSLLKSEFKIISSVGCNEID